MTEDYTLMTGEELAKRFREFRSQLPKLYRNKYLLHEVLTATDRRLNDFEGELFRIDAEIRRRKKGV